MSASAIPSSEVLPPAPLIGTWRRFGDVGPVYEIVAVGMAEPDGAPAMRIRVVETGEELDYPVRALLDDPSER